MTKQMAINAVVTLVVVIGALAIYGAVIKPHVETVA